jgi:membrane associated rhomboid family serine protease
MNLPAAAISEKTPVMRLTRGWELVAWSIALAVLHVPLFAGGSASALALLPERVSVGEWWRIITHPFVHVSTYHLLLDGAAFLFLWHGLRGSLGSRFATLAASAAGALLFAAFGSEAFWSVGLCGLSGIAHGLMVRQGLELWDSARSPSDRRLAAVVLAGVLGKCLLEAFTGAAFFSQWHLGPLGTPIVICHLGGACGALAHYALQRTLSTSRSWT